MINLEKIKSVCDSPDLPEFFIVGAYFNADGCCFAGFLLKKGGYERIQIDENYKPPSLILKEEYGLIDYGVGRLISLSDNETKQGKTAREVVDLYLSSQEINGTV